MIQRRTFLTHGAGAMVVLSAVAGDADLPETQASSVSASDREHSPATWIPGKNSRVALLCRFRSLMPISEAEIRHANI